MQNTELNDHGTHSSEQVIEHSYSAEPSNPNDVPMDSSAADLLPSSLSQGSEASLTPGQGTPRGTDDDMEESATAQRSEHDRYTLVTSRKRPKPSESPPKAPQVGPTVIFVPANHTDSLTKLSIMRVSSELENHCPESIQMIRPNNRLNLIAVDTRNAQATRSLLKLTSLCGVTVKSYEPGPRDGAVGVIKGVGDDVDDALLKAGLTSEIPVIHARRLGKSQVVRILFNGPKMPKYVLLSRVRYQVWDFEERPLQCANCGRFGHKTVVCTKNQMCSRCGGSHSRASCDASPLCVNCGSEHDALVASCPKQVEQRELAKSKRRFHYNDQSGHKYTTEVGPPLELLRPLQPLKQASKETSIQHPAAQAMTPNLEPRKERGPPQCSYRDALKNVQDKKHPPTPPRSTPTAAMQSNTQEHTKVNKDRTTNEPSTDNAKQETGSFCRTAINVVIDYVRRLLNDSQSEWAKVLLKLVDFALPYICTLVM
ncbi:uncharacterized protein ISCGN_017990 [Ixodes scapularis]